MILCVKSSMKNRGDFVELMISRNVRNYRESNSLSIKETSEKINLVWQPVIDEENDFEYVELDREESFVETLNRFKSANQKEYPLSKDYENIL